MEDQGKTPENSGFMGGGGFIILLIAGVIAGLLAIKYLFNL